MPYPDSQLPSSDADDTLNLIDLMVVVAENIKLLLLGTIFIGLVAWGATFLLPPRYESESWLRLDNGVAEASAAYFDSTDVLIPLLAKTPWVRGRESDAEGAVERLRDDIHASYSKTDRVLRVRVLAPSPEQARQLNTDLIEAFRVFTLPRGKELEQLQQQAERARGSLKELGLILDRLAQNMDKVTPGTEGDNVARAYINLFEQRAIREKALQDLDRKLTGFGSEVFVQSPNLPAQPAKPDKALIVLASTLMGGLGLLLFVFVRHGWRHASLHEDSAHKIQRICQSLGARNR